MKMKDIKHGDFVVGQAWQRHASTAWCLEMVRGQWGVVTTRCAMALMAVRHPHIKRHVVENTGNGPEVIAALRRGIPRASVPDDVAGELAMTRAEREQVEALLQRGMSGIVPVTPIGDKAARLRAVAPFIEAGDVWLPQEDRVVYGWGLAMVNSCAAFPNDEHDDIPDALSQALSMLLARAQGEIHRPPAGRAARAPVAGRIVGPRPTIGRRS
jgi:phage terminase large subunit-like protein